MRTHGHSEGSITHWGLLGDAKGVTAVGWGGLGGITLGEMLDVGDRGMEAAKTYCHVCTYATILHDLHMYPKT